MDRFMLGGASDEIIKADLIAGNAGPNITYIEDSESPDFGIGANWFQNGTAPVPANGDMPTDVTPAQFAAAKAMATGYTCARTECHGAVDAPGGQFVTNAPGFVGTHSSMSGHGTGTMKDVAGTVFPGCGPCHPGNGAGGYRREDRVVNPTARAYGCDQCHDLVGRATNSTAWPHANQGIDVYEWNSDGSRRVTTKEKVVAGNLWMYRSTIAQISPSKSGGSDTTRRSDISGLSVDPRFVISNYEDVNGTNLLTAGQSTDGVCLKCHVPTDNVSKIAFGVDPDKVNEFKLIPALMGNKSKAIHINPFIGESPSAPDSKYIFQYR
jgi:hypothetical protein